MEDAGKTIIEVNGVKLEVDLRYAKRVENIRIGDKVKVLTKVYDGHKVNAGIVVGFEPFKELPTIVIAYVEHDWNKADVKFLHYNKASKDVDVVMSVDDDLGVDRDVVCKRFDQQIAAKQREIDVIAEQKLYFETNFRAFWTRVEQPA